MFRAKTQTETNLSVNSLDFVYAARSGNYDTVVNLLFRDPTVLNKQDLAGFTAVNSAIFTLKTGMKFGKVNGIPLTNETALEYTKIICLLVEKGCDLNLTCNMPGREYRPIDTLFIFLNSQKLPTTLHNQLRGTLLTRADVKDQIERTTIALPATPARAVSTHAPSTWTPQQEIAEITTPQPQNRRNALLSRSAQALPPALHAETNATSAEAIALMPVATEADPEQTLWSYDPYNPQYSVRIHKTNTTRKGR